MKFKKGTWFLIAIWAVTSLAYEVWWWKTVLNYHLAQNWLLTVDFVVFSLALPVSIACIMGLLAVVYRGRGVFSEVLQEVFQQHIDDDLQGKDIPRH